MSLAAAWTGHDTLLVVWALVAIVGLIFLITRYKVHPFLALILASGFVGLASGLGASKVVETFTDGVGETLGGVGVIVALGTMLGKLMADSGGADQVVDTVLAKSGTKRLPWAMALIAMIIGIPLFFEVGVVLLMPVIFLMARRTGASVLTVGIPALAGLSVLHGLVPPHPGPLIAIDALKADLGETMLWGFVVAVPTVIVAGPLFAAYIGPRITPHPPEALMEEIARDDRPEENRPSFAVTLATLLLPVALMLVKTVADILWEGEKDNRVLHVADFVGAPVTALTISVLVAMFTFGYLRGFSKEKVDSLIGSSLAPIAGIVMIIGAGGGFKKMLIEGGIGDAIEKAAENSGISVILLAWLIAVAIRLATGSATVATITTAGIIAPLAASSDTNLSLLALAIGAGSLFFSHVNDAGFWLVKEYFGMTVGQTIRSWSIMETLISVVAIAIILPLSLVV
ncbi:gluconate:H+ symporter [Spirillospora sp. CA-294931]|uniref:GntT/GntP/DsdX family permease n=1 Tax=Spirillospora sp. CA-294931 TaxID=3240042 RepID=UPI003D917E6F